MCEKDACYPSSKATISVSQVRDIFHKKLHISRDMAIHRITRLWYGPDCRGYKPIQIAFSQYKDKEEVLRKARLLKGGSIYLSEDFSRKVRQHRHELIKFMKEVKSRDPARRMVLRYDKLYIGTEIYFYNDLTNRIERQHNGMELGHPSRKNSALLENMVLNEAQVKSLSLNVEKYFFVRNTNPFIHPINVG